MAATKMTTADKIALGAVISLTTLIVIVSLFLALIGFVFSPLVNALVLLGVGGGAGLTFYANSRSL